MEKKYMIFYYDTDEEGVPIPNPCILQDVCNVLKSFFEDKNIDCLLLPKNISHSNEKTKEEMKKFLLIYLNKILASERGEKDI